MSRVLKTLVVLLPAAACLSGPKQDLSALSRRSALSLAPSIGAAALVSSGATGGQLLRVPSAGAAVFLLGRLSFEGEDYGEVARLLRLSADLGHAGAQFMLGCCHGEGKGMPQDFAMANRYFLLTADQGLADAQINIAVSYRDGLGIPQSHTKAARYFLLAADQGSATGQMNLAMSYDEGRGGIAHAQSNYAMACLHGEGVPQDHEEGARYLRLAADQGYTPSMLALGTRLVDDQDVPADERTLEPALAGSFDADDTPHRLQALELMRSHADKREIVSATAVAAGSGSFCDAR
ncbi:hypothetical protein T492DRAFT_908214 [Pavlovales sp. CCMP2436]|nr:hypothetical protein T492DRAFT_908214 [Pavlovales sp. CCMP2436]